MAVTLENISFNFGDKRVLRNFSHTFPEQGVVGLIGPSGCGKTTLLHILAGLREPQTGAVRGPAHRRVSMVFQEDRLLPWVSAAQNVALTLPQGLPEQALPWLELVELREEAQSLPRQLSGGMRRRVALARALAYNGDILLLDEPTNGLDEALAGRIMARVKKLYAQKLVVVASHGHIDADVLLEPWAGDS